MQRKSSFIWKTVIGGIFVVWVAMGCNTNGVVDPGQDNDDDNASQFVKNVSNSSVGIFNNVASFRQVSTLIQGSDAIADLEVPEVENPSAAISFAKSVQQRALDNIVLDPRALYKATADSVIWDVTYEESETGITRRSSLIYDFETGIGRLFFVGLQFPEDHPIVYDSTEIIANLNLTLDDDSDDVLISLQNLKRYRPGQLIDEEKGSFEPDAYAPGSEPKGGVLNSEITYSSSSFISRTNARFEFHEGQGGSYSKESIFSDGKSSREAATFNVDGTGTFSQERRDGTQVEGTFDSAEEDGAGSYSQTTTFPAGHDPVSISESGDFTIDASDSTINGSFEREVTYQDRTESESVIVNQTLVGEVKTTTLTVENSDGSNGFINIVESPDVDQVSGEFTNADETFVIFSAQSYSDGSSHLKLKLYASEVAFEAGEEPIVCGEFDLYPDGSGHGEVREGDKTYEITINPDGSVTVKEVTT